MKRIVLLSLLFYILHPTVAQTEETKEPKKVQLDIGGALRFNYNLSTWKPNQIKRGGDFGFEVFRINVDAVHNDWEIHLDQRFYSTKYNMFFFRKETHNYLA